jgi:hypothetical protein
VEGCCGAQGLSFHQRIGSEGHPDKVLRPDLGRILDAFIANDIKLGIADDSHANTGWAARRWHHQQDRRSPAKAARPSRT